MSKLQQRAARLCLVGMLTLGWAIASPPAWASGPQRVAQYQPPAVIPGQGDDGQDDAGDASAMVLRMGRLESQLRTLTGQIEELQFQNKQLQDNLRKLSQDVDFRFQDLQGHPTPGAPAAARPPAQRRGDALPGTNEATSPAVAAALPADAAVGTATTAAPAPGNVARTSRSGDAFDPSANPDAPGAPRPLGTTTPSAPLRSASSAGPAGGGGSRAPLDLMRRPAAVEPAPTASADTPSIIAAPPAAARALPDPNAVASLVPGGTREEFDTDLGQYKQGQFDTAATGFQTFLTKYPKDRLVPDAVFFLGDSYSRLGRHREAAEQFLKLSTDYAKSSRAPDALLRLGISLNALGAKEQACATYAEVTRKYPTASTEVRAGVDRELKRSRCRSDG